MKAKTIGKVASVAGATALLTVALLGPASSVAREARARPAPDPPATADRRPVDLVICLDTSGSMTQLIDSARAKLWDIVNELAGAKPLPRLRVGLLTYGTPELSSAEQGWVVLQTDLTDDLDTVYAKMMGMTTSGGDEFVGWVLNDALQKMTWSDDPNALKIVFVAGNESADQAQERFDFRYVAQYAKANSVFVNAIYAGGRRQGINEKWQEVAVAGGGTYAAIDMSEGLIQIPTPQDDVLYRLNIELNATYLPYGARGAAACANQTMQDSNAEKMGVQSNASRVAAKASSLYTNAFWDLVDAMQSKDFDLDKVKREELPEAMRDMTPEQCRAHIETKTVERTRIQQKIAEVNVEREKYLRSHRERESGKVSLDDAILKALRDQASSKGFAFDASATAAEE